MRIEDIVPPLELCKKIPEGAFEDSALVWNLEVAATRHHGEWWEVVYRESTCEDEEFYPAPTLAEIMHELCQSGEPVDVTLWRTGQCAVMVNREEEECEEVSCFPAEAALKLWLELNNERNENGKN